ncbi:MAG: AAA family ATPase [Desulfobacteraceae bacterium]|nr:MAG: AAA family ATPase [Desulfobacteraceae bacterium]
MTGLYGRRSFLKRLAEPLLAGRTFLLYGPVGSGKSSLLEDMAQSMKKQGRPCGFCRCTRALSDITEGLLAAYPQVKREGRTQRQLRSYLVDAIEARPGVLLLDHLREVGTQFKGYLRSMRGTGLDVLLVADAGSQRDHERLRATRLAYQEIIVPPLARRAMHRILAEAILPNRLPFALPDVEKSALIRMARGRPGWMILAGRILSDTHYWRDGRVLKESLRAEIMTRIARTYFADPVEPHVKKTWEPQ